MKNLATLKLAKKVTNSFKFSARYLSAAKSEEIIFNSPCKPLEIPTKNVTDFVLNRFADHWQDNPALVCGFTGKQFLYKDVSALTKKFGSHLLENGFSPGDKIATIVPNCPEFGPVLLGSLGVGVTLVPVSPLLTPTEVGRILGIAQPKMIVTCDPLLPLVQAALNTMETKVPIVTITDNSTTSAIPFMECMKNDGSLFETKPDLDPTKTLAILPFSSGTTGPPKGVMLTHQNLTTGLCLGNDINSGCVHRPLPIGVEQYIALSIIPMFHIYGLVYNVMQPLTLGVKMVSLPKFDAGKFIGIMEAQKPTYMNLVPPLVMMLALNPIITKEKHLAKCEVISSGGSPISTQILQKLKQKCPEDCELKDGYAMTEVPLITRTVREGSKPGSAGKLVSNVIAKVVDLDTNKSVGPNVTGELLVKGPHVMLGYYQNEEATKECFTEDSWFRTGDVVYFDESGDIFIVDRIKDMIKVKGYQVSPTEVEEEIRKVPGVLDVAVIGVQDDRAGEVPKAFIVPATDEVTAEKINDFLSDKLAKYKKLTGGIVLLKELPKSPTGKVLRKELRKM